MKTNSFKTFSLGVLLIVGLLISGCSVGAKIAVSAYDVQHPVSQTGSFYDSQNLLKTEADYEPVKDFNFTFTKWDVSSIIEIKNSEDISNRLNKIIEKHDGDAIVNLRISVHNPAGKNGLLWFSKTLTTTASVLFTFLAISDPQPEFTAIAVSSTGIALFTPAAADIKVAGTVVRISDSATD
ncbi:hypothetical protein [Gracilimonas sp.]|uniref:hypothetical protein n=1 Tax=Gracilimonas sp. TaxID=1974203 RepID=UPI003BAB0250